MLNPCSKPRRDYHLFMKLHIEINLRKARATSNYVHPQTPLTPLYFAFPLVSPPISPLIAREPMPLLWADTQKASACASALSGGNSPEMFSISLICLLSQSAVPWFRVVGSTGASCFAPLMNPRHKGLLQVQVNPWACRYVSISKKLR